MGKKVIKVLKHISTVLIALVIILAILLVGVRLFGLKVYTVLSGSMEPEYHTGSVIYVKEVDPAELKANDVITFTIGEGTTATHRIIELVPDEEDPSIIRFRTKGDANDMIDGSLVEYDSVIGTPVFTLPYLGYLAAFIQKPPGSYVAIAISIALVLFVIVVDMLSDDKDKKSKKKQTQSEQN